MNRFQEALNELYQAEGGEYMEECETLQELVDKEIRVNTLHKELYGSYHHGTREETDEIVSRIVENIELDWNNDNE